MTYAVFDTIGNLIDAFTERAAALDRLAGLGQAEPESAAEVLLVAQAADGTTVGDPVYASSVSVPA
jgi:hypothetical protein